MQPMKTNEDESQVQQAINVLSNWPIFLSTTDKAIMAELGAHKKEFFASLPKYVRNKVSQSMQNKQPILLAVPFVTKTEISDLTKIRHYFYRGQDVFTWTFTSNNHEAEQEYMHTKRLMQMDKKLKNRGKVVLLGHTGEYDNAKKAYMDMMFTKAENTDNMRFDFFVNIVDFMRDTKLRELFQHHSKNIGIAAVFVRNMHDALQVDPRLIKYGIVEPLKIPSHVSFSEPSRYSTKLVIDFGLEPESPTFKFYVQQDIKRILGIDIAPNQLFGPTVAEDYSQADLTPPGPNNLYNYSHKLSFDPPAHDQSWYNLRRVDECLPAPPPLTHSVESYDLYQQWKEETGMP